MEERAKAGQSSYPIMAGHVFRLHDKIKKIEPKSGLYQDHTAYLWILRLGRRKKDQQPKKRIVFVIQLLVPDKAAFQANVEVKKTSVQLEYIVTRLGRGYDLLSKNCRWNYTKWSLKNFYRLVGVL